MPNFSRKFLFCLIFIGFLQNATALSPQHFDAQNQAPWQQLDYIEKAFFEIAYKNEYSPKRRRGLIRWQTPIRYQIQYFKTPAPVEIAEQLVRHHFKDLASITKTAIVRSVGTQTANFKIIFTRKQFYQKAVAQYANTRANNLHNTSNCLVAYHYNKKFQITHATAIIPLDHVMSRGLLPSCIVEELTQSMGLTNDSDWVYPSIANDKSVLDLLTGLDYLLLKLLYHPDLKTGMTVAQSTPIIRRILKNFKQNGLIQASVLQTKQLRINQFLR